MNIKLSHCDVCLSIMSEVLSTQEITRILKISPTKCHEKGTPINPRNPQGKVYPAWLWTLKSSINKEESLNRHINEIISLLENNKAEFEQLLKVCESDLFCGFFSSESYREFSLDSHLIQRLADLSIELIVIVYTSNPD
jgi:Domain of unknown function (DUF4279)